jgi:undecaprenyl pyrophosphate phosphatase UppP
MTHFLLMLLFATFVSIVFGLIGRETRRERIFYGMKVFGEFICIGLIMAWILYWFPN